jgi:ADP-ribose pyrophosphatase
VPDSEKVSFYDRENVLNPWVTLVKSNCSKPDSEPPYFHLRVPDYVCAIAITKDGKVPLVRQFRIPARQDTLELPGGLVDIGNSPLQSVIQELREEVGAIAMGSSKKLPVLMVDTGRIENSMHSFVIYDFQADFDNAMEEEIENLWVSIPELVQLALRGEIQHSGHVASILIAHSLGYI